MAGSRRKSKKQLEPSSVLGENDPARKAQEIFEEQHSQPVEREDAPRPAEEFTPEPVASEERDSQRATDTEPVAPKGYESPLAIKTGAPFSDIFPINSGTRQAIQEHIRDHGFDEAYPLILGTGPWTEEPVLLDGHTRLKAAIAVGCESVPVVVKEFATEDEALEYAIHNQRDRRNLMDADLLRLVALVDERRQKGGDRKSEEAKSITPNGAIEKLASPSSHATARTLGISPRKVERTRTVLDHAPKEVKQAVQAGEMTINTAYKETQKQRREQATAPESLQGAEQNVVTTVVVQQSQGPRISLVVVEDIVKAKIPRELLDSLPWERDLRPVVVQAVQEFLDRHSADPKSEVSPLQELSQDEPSSEPPPNHSEPDKTGPYSEHVEERLELLGCKACAGFRRTGNEALCNCPTTKGDEPLDFTGPAFDCPKVEAQAQGGAPF